MAPSNTIIIGAAGAVGKRLCAALTRAGSKVIASDRGAQLPSSIKQVAAATVGNVDVRDEEALVRLFKQYATPDTAVWNLASPLSVETALSPDLAREVTVGGMTNVLSAMRQVGARRICFTDSIGSFGATSPRDNCSASWLVANPDQDPGSDYGLQKRACRELLDEFARTHNGDPRVAILPGVLHNEPVWGNGTTEYALDAMLAASRGEDYVCPIDMDTVLPMVFTDDLMRGLVCLQMAGEAELKEPQRLYAIPGLSFSAAQLFKEIRVHMPKFATSTDLNANMNKFASLWPDTLSTTEPLRDLDYEAEVTLPRMVASVLNAHSSRKLSSTAAFRSIDTCESGRVNDYMLEKYVRKYMVRGRERFEYGPDGRRQDAVAAIVTEMMAAMDVDSDGKVSMEDFMLWSRTNNVESYVDDYMAEKSTQKM